MGHLKDLDKTWYQHFKFALYLSIKLAKLSILGLIHSVFPNLFVTSVSDGINELKEELRMVNSNLWDVEDRLRECEKKKLFNQYFIELARSVYQLNDKRAAIKKKINLRSGSRLIEEKSYKKYD